MGIKSMRIKSAFAASCAALIATAAADDAIESEVLESQPAEEAIEQVVEPSSEPVAESTEDSVIEQADEVVDQAPAEEAEEIADLPVSEEALDQDAEKKIRRIEKRQQERNEVRERLEAFAVDRSKWRLSSNVAFANVEIEIEETELVIPEDFALEDIDLEIPELTDLSSTLFIASAGYRILPIVELTGQIGYVSSETATPFQLTTTIPEPDIALDLGLIDFDEPVTLNLDRDEDISGYAYGLGANVLLPVGIVAGRPLIATTNVLYNWNRLDGGNVNSETLTGSATLTYAVLSEKALYTFSAGAGYTRLKREASRDLELAGQIFGLNTEQKIERPWSVNMSLSRSLTDKWSIGYGISMNTGGPISQGVSLIFTPKKRK